MSRITTTSASTTKRMPVLKCKARNKVMAAINKTTMAPNERKRSRLNIFHLSRGIQDGRSAYTSPRSDYTPRVEETDSCQHVHVDRPYEVTHRTKASHWCALCWHCIVDCDHMVQPRRLPHRLTPQRYASSELRL